MQPKTVTYSSLSTLSGYIAIDLPRMNWASQRFRA